MFEMFEPIIHSMLIIGYIMKKQKCYYIIKNTWGKDLQYFTISDDTLFKMDDIFLIHISTFVETQILINSSTIIPSEKPILINPPNVQDLSEIPPPIIIDALEAKHNLNENNDDIIINLNGKKCPNGYIKSKIDNTKCIKKNVNQKNKIISFIKSKKNPKQDNINIIGNKTEKNIINSFIKSDDDNIINLNKSKTKKNKIKTPPKQENIINLNGKKCPAGYTRNKKDKTKCVTK